MSDPIAKANERAIALFMHKSAQKFYSSPQCNRFQITMIGPDLANVSFGSTGSASFPDGPPEPVADVVASITVAGAMLDDLVRVISEMRATKETVQ